MEQENFSPQQSLALIHSMIGKAQQRMSDKSVYFLLWGWITFVAFCLQFLLKHVLEFDKHYLVWIIVIPGVILTVYLGSNDRKKHHVSSYIGDSIRYLWTGMGITFFVLSWIVNKAGWGTSIYPFYIMLYGLGTFVSGSILRFRPLIIGGLLAFGIAIVASYLSYDYQMLAGALSILVSYIIPAHMLRARNQSVSGDV